MKTKFNGILALLLALVVQFTFAQEKQISGTVSDETGPLPGVSVIIKGTSNGVETDFDGLYQIMAKQGDVLVFSYVGMEEKNVTVGSSNLLNVKMTGGNLLEEVVVVAYGSQSRKSIVGAVAVIDSEVLENQQVSSVTSALQGSVSGVNIVSAGGQPGDNPTIRIRGIGSINASADPLIILDGAPFNGNLNTISSDQIKSMNVLKDASSTALYGSRGANGVILITTKRGRVNSPTVVDVKSSIGFSRNAVKFHSLNSTDQFMRYSWEAMRNSYQYVDGETAADAGQLASDNLVSTIGYNPYDSATPVNTNGELVSTNKKWDTDWGDYLLNDNAIRQEHGINISGGSDNTTYFFSANYLDQNGAIKTSNFQRITNRLNIDTKVNDWFNTGLSASYSTSKQNYPTQSGSSYQSAQQWYYSLSSVYPVYKRDANGDYALDSKGNKFYDYGDTGGQSVNGVRPVFEGENGVGALYNYDELNKRDNFTANGYAQITFSDNLNAKTQISFEKFTFNSYSYVHNEYGYAANVGGRVSQDRDFITSTNITNSLNYNKTFNEAHTLSVNLIHEAYERNADELSAQGVGYLPNVKVLNGSTTPEYVGGSFTDETLLSYLGRVAYNYNEKYFIEGSFRRDGSSRFGEDVRWGDFYSVGGSYVISDEDFLADSDVLTYLKLRSSYGELGNNRGIGYFPYLSLFETGYNELGNTGVVLGGVADPNLTWEKTSSFNVGLDFRLFNDAIRGSVDYYSKESVDLIYDQPLAISTGNSSITTNVGAIKNSGIEISLNSNNISKGDFTWTTNLNLSFDKNEITELTQDGFINGTKRWEEGRSLYEFYTYEWAGVDPDTGYGMWFKDVLDGEGNPTGDQETTLEYSEASRNYVDKSSLPDFIGGLTNYVRYGNFDLNVLVNFSMGATILDGTYQSLMDGFSRAGRASSSDISDRWQQPGDITDTPLLLNASNDFNGTSTRFLFDNDYLRLKAVTLGYNLPTETVNKFGVSKLRFYFQGDNLATFQSHKGIDPEQSLAGTTNSRSYNQKIFSFGINLAF